MAAIYKIYTEHDSLPYALVSCLPVLGWHDYLPASNQVSFKLGLVKDMKKLHALGVAAWPDTRRASVWITALLRYTLFCHEVDGWDETFQVRRVITTLKTPGNANLVTRQGFPSQPELTVSAHLSIGEEPHYLSVKLTQLPERYFQQYGNTRRIPPHEVAEMHCWTWELWGELPPAALTHASSDGGIGLERRTDDGLRFLQREWGSWCAGPEQ